ncbi:MAG: hypothetical protein JNM18_15270 [Planctomycetaceae bacterium]|nr:hypothetical protein [Planctomycetaceae bacterium]
MATRSPLMLVLGVVIPLAIVANVAWWWLQRPTTTADGVIVAQGQLAVLDDQRAIVLLRRSGDQHATGLTTLVAGLTSKRAALVTQAKLGLLKQLDAWTLDPPDAAEQQRLTLAELLASHADQYDAPAQRVAVDLATRMLTEPCSDAAVSARLLTACERVLHASSDLREPPQIGTPAATPTAAVEAAGLLQPNTELPQLRLPVELQLPPLPVAATKKTPSLLVKPASTQVPNPIDRSQPTDKSPQLQPVPANGRLQPQPSPHVERQALGDLTMVELFKLWHAAPVAHRKTIEHELKDRGITARQIEIGAGLTSPQAEERLQWIEQLPRLTGLDPKPWLLWLSQDAVAEVRLAALRVMATTNDPVLLRRASELSGSDDSSEVRELAAKLLKGVDGGTLRR